ncbi:MAG: hypothetical protein UW24_C0015G0020 [Parcubacteria group bacterium GW2011_GWA2_44_12]|nr:MAG: hypothetical protein UW24_C0015G0020 [Parcubacteria group bacterium GW2011_GWA2_44_12]
MFQIGEKIIAYATKHYDPSLIARLKAGRKTTWLALRQSLFEFLIILFSDAGQSFIILKKREEDSVSQLSYIQYKLYTKKLRLLPFGFFSTLAFTGLLIPYALNARTVVMNGGIHFAGYEIIQAQSGGSELKEKKIYNRLIDDAPQASPLKVQNEHLQPQISDLQISDAERDRIEFTSSVDEQAPRVLALDVETLLVEKDKKIKVLISWKTNEPVKSILYWDKGVARGRKLKYVQEVDEDYSLTHVSVLENFEKGSTYQLRVAVTDKAGNKGISQDSTFLTPTEENNIINLIWNALTAP